MQVGEINVKIGADTDGLNKGVKQAKSSINDIGTSSQSASKKVDLATASMSKSFMSMRTAGVAAAAAVAAIGTATVTRNIIEASAEFQRLEASLVTVTGSAEKAESAFKIIKDFAATTPYALTEVTDSFIKMKSLGLDPSMEALRSYGNTASSMGKSLNQMIEAVADASTGEFERLKEFGIKSRKEGDNVTFTFNNTTTTIKNSAEAIQKYLKNIGDTKFAGGMERQMETLGGKLSNLSDQWDKAYAAMGESSSGVIGGTIQLLTDLGSTMENLFLTSDQLAEKMGWIATETEKVNTAKRTLTLQLEAATIAQQNIQIALDATTASLTAEQAEVVKTSEYYKNLENQLASATTQVNLLKDELGAVDFGQDSDFAKIQKQFENIEEKNNKYYERQKIARDKAREQANEAAKFALEEKEKQDAAWIETLKAFHEEERNEIEEARLRKLEDKENTQSNLEALQEQYMSEKELLIAKYEEQQLIIDEAYMNEQLSYEEHQIMMNEINKRYAQERIQIAEEESAQEKALRASTLSAAVGFLNVLGKENKAAAVAAIAITKGLAIAETIAHTQTASMLAFSSQLIPGDPSSIARAAAASSSVQTMGAVKVGLIAATGLLEASSAMGGSGASAVSSTVGSTSSATSTTSPSAVTAPVGGTLTVEGLSASSLFTGDAVAAIATELLDYQREGGQVVLQS